MTPSKLNIHATGRGVQIFGSAASSRSQLHVLCEIRASRVAPRQKSIATAADALKPLDQYRNSSWRFFAALFAGSATPAVQRTSMAAC
jgi:hypothetical protein